MFVMGKPGRGRAIRPEKAQETGDINEEPTPLRCGNCEKELSTDMEIEYSEWLTEYFCSPDCAMQRYFEYMYSAPVDLANLLPGIKIVNGKLYRENLKPIIAKTENGKTRAAIDLVLKKSVSKITTPESD